MSGTQHLDQAAVKNGADEKLQGFVRWSYPAAFAVVFLAALTVICVLAWNSLSGPGLVFFIGTAVLCVGVAIDFQFRCWRPDALTEAANEGPSHELRRGR